jgi:hypothetical protein
MAARRIAFNKVRSIFFDLTSVPDLSDPLVNGWGGAAAFNHAAATPNRAVRMAEGSQTARLRGR